jgi:hypothetical protein
MSALADKIVAPILRQLDTIASKVKATQTPTLPRRTPEDKAAEDRAVLQQATRSKKE